MAWSSDQLDRVSGSEELHISSYRRDGSLRRWTTIWVVRVGDDLYVRSVYGTEGGWYRNAMRHHRARIQAGGVETDVTLEPVTSTAINDEVAAAYSAKYRSQPGALRPILENTAAETTVRLLADDI